ncbi:MAG: hypothetical protein WCH98_19675 [Verrucomicrobiota bacterium]
MLLVVFALFIVGSLRADPGRIYTKPDPLATGGIEGTTSMPLTHALAIDHDRVRVYQADLSDGGKSFHFFHLPVGKYDLVLVANGAVYEGLSLGDPAESLDATSAQNLRTRIGAADSFFDRFTIHRAGLNGDQALAFVERIRDRPTLKQSGEKLDANLRRFEIIELAKADDDWQMATTRHIYREEEPVRKSPPFMKHFFVSAIGNLRVVDTVKQLGTLALPPN